MHKSRPRIREEYLKIIENEKLPIGDFSYEVYLGADIYFKRQDNTGLWNITVYQRLQGTPRERLMVISAFATIKRKEQKWYKDETEPFKVVGPEIQNEFLFDNQKSEEIAEEVLCYIRDSLQYMFEVDFLLAKKYLPIEDIIELAKYYQSISIMPSMVFQFLATISALKKHKGHITEFNEDIISLKRYELFQVIDIGEKVLNIQKITKKHIIDIFNLLYPDRQNIASIFELQQKLHEIRGSDKCYILSEDSKSNTLLKVIFEANGFDFSKTTILSYESCSQIGSVKLFSNFVKQKFPNIEIIVHRDRDYLTNEEITKLELQFEEIGVYLFITNGTDIESHYVNKYHINECYPEITIDEANILIEKSLIKVKEKSIDLLKKKEFGEKYKNKSSHLESAINDIYESEKLRFSHGKTLYKSVKSLIQKRIKKNPNLEVPSEFLKIEKLEDKVKIIYK